MKYVAQVFAVLLLLAVHSFICAAGGADFAQLPDMARGFDFSSQIQIPSTMSTMADDWVAGYSSPVETISWWGSYWYHTGNPTYYSGMQQNAPAGDIASFVIKFWTDVPANPNVAYSTPGQVVRDAIYEIPIAQVNETLYGRVTYNDFGYEDVYKYTVTLPRGFNQVQGTIYWLSIQANLPSAIKQWGWHNSTDHHFDFATQKFLCSDWYPPCGGTDMAFQLGFGTN